MTSAEAVLIVLGPRRRHHPTKDLPSRPRSPTQYTIHSFTTARGYVCSESCSGGEIGADSTMLQGTLQESRGVAQPDSAPALGASKAERCTALGVSLVITDRNSQGYVFTPTHLVRWMVRALLPGCRAPLANVTALDGEPTCVGKGGRSPLLRDVQGSGRATTRGPGTLTRLS